MRHLLLTLGLITSLALAACGGDASGPAGTYEIDKTDIKALIIAGAKKQAGVEELPAAAMAKVEEMLASMSATLVLKSDGTYTFKADMGGEKEDESGTWSLDGDKLTTQATQKAGKDVKDDAEVATFKDGVISRTNPKDPSEKIRFVRKK